METIPRNTTDNCSKYSPKIGPLTDLHTRDGIVATSPLRSEVAKKIIQGCGCHYDSPLEAISFAAAKCGNFTAKNVSVGTKFFFLIDESLARNMIHTYI